MRLGVYEVTATLVLPLDRAGLMALLAFRVTPDGQSHAYTWARAVSDLYVADGLT